MAITVPSRSPDVCFGALLGAGEAMTAYHFGTGSFATELWISSKMIFKRPISVDVEFSTAGPFDWLFANRGGAIVKSLRHDNSHGGWTSINFASLGLYDDYAIGFQNVTTSQQIVKQGDVHLDD